MFGCQGDVSYWPELQDHLRHGSMVHCYPYGGPGHLHVLNCGFGIIFIRKAFRRPPNLGLEIFTDGEPVLIDCPLPASVGFQ